MIKILSGPNRMQVDKELNKIVANFTGRYGNLAVERFDGEDIDFDDVLTAASTLPFLAEKKLVIISRLSGNKPAAARIEDILEKTHGSIDVVIVEDKLDKRSQYYKTLKPLEGWSEFKEVDERELVNWVASEVKSEGGEISRADAVQLINRVGASQQRLGSEIDKLLLYDRKITRENIELLTVITPQSSVFNLLDKAFAGNTAAALKLYEEQRQQNVEPYNILALVSWQLHAMALVKSTAPPDGKISSSELAEKSGLSPYVAGKTLSLVKPKSLADITALVERVADMEYKSKTSSVDIDEALKNFIISL